MKKTTFTEQVTDSRKNVMTKSKRVYIVLVSLFLPLAIFEFVQLVVALALAPFFPGLSDRGQTVSILGTFVFSLVFSLLSLALVGAYLKLSGKGLKRLGIGPFRIRYFKPIFIAVGIYVVLVFSAFMLIAALAPDVNMDQEQVVGFEGIQSTLELILAFISLVIITPITEEVLVRGLMFRGMKKAVGFVAAALISAAVFGLLHGQLNVSIDTFILGLLLAWLVNKTDSLLPAIFVHMLKNFVAFTFLYLL